MLSLMKLVNIYGLKSIYRPLAALNEKYLSLHDSPRERRRAVYNVVYHALNHHHLKNNGKSMTRIGRRRLVRSRRIRAMIDGPEACKA